MDVYNTMYYLIIGFLLGTLLYRFMLSIKSGKKFSKSILPAIQAMKAYSYSLSENIKNNVSTINDLDEKRRELEKALTSQKGMYPEWVYKKGFNPILSAGARLYLIRLERIAELLIATEFILSQSDSLRSLIAQNLQDLIRVMEGNEELLSYLAAYFEKKQAVTTEKDYTTDVKQLDESIRRSVPESLELLDMAPEYIDLVSIGRNLKDIRQVLLNLIASLPERDKQNRDR